MSGIYLHIPYCRKACIYCDFHFSTQLKTKTDLVNAIVKELKQHKNYLTDEVSTIYFGGGTPSLLEKSEVEIIMETIHSNFNLSQNPEITFEFNPDDVSKDYLKSLIHLGINRLSIGIQSFDNEELKWMNRSHNALQSENCVRIAQEQGIKNISADLIYGSRFQTEEIWENNLQKVFDLNIQHLSCYNLTIEERTVLGNLNSKKIEPAINDERSATYFETLVRESIKNGFIQYEISNFGKENFFSQHNSSYWKGAHYLGVGPSAHSYNGFERRWNVRNNAQFIHKINNNEIHFETETLSFENKFNEYILTGLRTIWGCDLNVIEQQFGEKIKNNLLTDLKKSVEKELIFITGNKVLLTENGKLFADKIASELFI